MSQAANKRIDGAGKQLGVDTTQAIHKFIAGECLVGELHEEHEQLVFHGRQVEYCVIEFDFTPRRIYFDAVDRANLTHRTVVARAAKDIVYTGNELAGLELKTILVIAVLSAALSASAHYYAFWFVPQTDHSFEQLVSMFIGDTIGSLIVLYLISAGLRLLTRLHTDSMKSQ